MNDLGIFDLNIPTDYYQRIYFDRYITVRRNGSAKEPRFGGGIN
jgi:hypothetical protein